jgi:hypothetical protein
MMLGAGNHQIKMEYYEAYVHAVAVPKWRKTDSG